MRLKQHRIPAPIHGWSNALNRHLVAPAIAVVENVLERLAVLQLQSVKRCRCRAESAIHRSRIVERYWRYVLLRTYYRAATSWRLRKVEGVQVLVEPVERREDLFMQLRSRVVVPTSRADPRPRFACLRRRLPRGRFAFIRRVPIECRVHQTDVASRRPHAQDVRTACHAAPDDTPTLVETPIATAAPGFSPTQDCVAARARHESLFVSQQFDLSVPNVRARYRLSNTF